MAVMTFIESIRDTLAQEMRRDESMVILGEDVGNRGGVFRISMGWMEEFGESRVIDTPLAESAIVGVAIGIEVNSKVGIVTPTSGPSKASWSRSTRPPPPGSRLRSHTPCPSPEARRG